MRLRLALIAICVAASVSVMAQLRYRPTETGPWRPWSFTAVDHARKSRGATAAEVQAFQARLQELAAIVKRAPGVSPPIGFAGELWGSLTSHYPETGRPPGRAVPLAGALSFGAFPLIEFMRGGRLVNEDLKGGETELLQFEVNEIGERMYGGTRPDGWGEVQLDAFVEPAAGAAVAGLPRLGDVFVVRKNPKPLWVPLALSEALQPIETTRRGAFEQARDVYAKEVKEFAEWTSPAKRAARRRDWQQAATSMPNGGAEFLANMEQSEPQIEAATAARLAPGGPEDKRVREAESEWREIDGIVAALSPDARNAPSCYDRGASRLADRFRALAGAPASCRALVRPNADYFDANLPRSSPQVLMIATFTRCLRPQSIADTTSRGGCVINRALVESMDWDAVRDWLDR
ncbi:MAG: hypothetical protein IT178_17755 [Acidobacteria bacterium]|nr:hypothetical protein [Acidobacteriota bacterium]